MHFFFEGNGARGFVLRFLKTVGILVPSLPASSTFSCGYFYNWKEKHKNKSVCLGGVVIAEHTQMDESSSISHRRSSTQQASPCTAFQAMRSLQWASLSVQSTSLQIPSRKNIFLALALFFEEGVLWMILSISWSRCSARRANSDSLLRVVSHWKSQQSSNTHKQSIPIAFSPWNLKRGNNKNYIS